MDQVQEYGPIFLDYQFKSSFFRHWEAKAWRKAMVQENPKENAVKVAFCTSCGAAYLLSEERPHSACHGTDPVLVYDLETLFETIETLSEAVMVLQGAVLELKGIDPNADAAAGKTKDAPPRAASRRRDKPAPPPEAGSSEGSSGGPDEPPSVAAPATPSAETPANGDEAAAPAPEATDSSGDLAGAASEPEAAKAGAA